MPRTGTPSSSRTPTQSSKGTRARARGPTSPSVSTTSSASASPVPSAAEVLEALRPLGKESYKRVMVRNHGVREPCFGVPISELKKFQKRLGRAYQLANDLYASGNYDAMYLAGLIADDARMTEEDLERWVDRAEGGCLTGTTVPSVAAGSPHGWKLAQRWIDSRRVHVAAAGWATLSCLVSVKPDADLDLAGLERLLERVRATLSQAPDAVRYQMNGFLIAAGCFVRPLTAKAIQIAAEIGPVTADLGPNACKVPSAAEYIRKVQQRGTLGRKRASAKC